MPTPHRWLFATLASSCVLLAEALAHANPRPLPLTYPYETLSEDESEIEQYVDISPLRAEDEQMKKVWEPRYVLQTEYEYGITDHLELGLYLQFESEPQKALVFDGIKQRLRLRLAEEGEWPIDVAVYGEVSEFHDELELEEKLILSKRFDDFRVMANLWLEQSFERYSGKPEMAINPTGGVTYQATPHLHMGLEYWLHAPLENESGEFAGKAHHYVGPALCLQWGKVWWSTAAYWRADHGSRATEIGDVYGHAWVRTVFGLVL